MKKQVLLIVIMAISSAVFSQHVKIESTGGGFLIPKIDTSSVISPEIGLMIFQTPGNAFYYYSGSNWVRIGAGIVDEDGDTRVIANDGTGNDSIVYTIDGLEAFHMKRNVGGHLMFNVISPSRNLFMGQIAGLNSESGANLDGKYNTVYGNFSFVKNVSGYDNTAVGYQSLNSNISGHTNTALGIYTMTRNTIGNANTALGNNSLTHNTDGSNNVALGTSTLSSNILGNQNTALGFEAGRNAVGSGNIFIGNKSGFSEIGSNKLYIDNNGADKENALIYGEFDNKYLQINGRQEVKLIDGDGDNYSAIKGIIESTNVTTVQHKPAILGENKSIDRYGIGVQGRGGRIGVSGEVSGNGGGDYVGTVGFSHGSSQGTNHGILGHAINGERNFGVFGATAITSGVNWAGYFEGKAYIQDSLKVNGIGHFNSNIDVIGIANVVGALNVNGVGNFSDGVLVNGNMGIGLINPEKNLHIFDSDDPTIKLQSDGISEISGRISLRQSNESGMDMYYDGASDEMVFESFLDGNSKGKFFYIDQNYKSVGVGISPIHPLHMESGARCTTAGVWTDASDQRLKKEIKNITYGLDEIMKLRPVAYKMKSNDEEQIGFIAQEVREILPELISGKEGDIEAGETLGMGYGQLSSVIVKAMQEQQNVIDNLKSELANQSSEIELLKAGMAELKAAIELK